MKKTAILLSLVIALLFGAGGGYVISLSRPEYLWPKILIGLLVGFVLWALVVLAGFLLERSTGGKKPDK